MPLRRNQTSEDGTETVGSTSHVDSRLLPQLFAGIETRDQITVLDLGSGSSATLNYFSQLDAPARVTFADVLEARPKLDALADSEDPFDPIEAMDIWRVQLDLAPATQIDYILFWDYLHYFQREAIEALSNAIQPHIHKETRGYGFGSLHSDKPIRRGKYAVGNDAQVIITPEADRLPFSHSQQVIADNFICLQISRGTLLQEGHLELLLEV